MKKNQVNTILGNSFRRKSVVIGYVCIITFLFVIMCSLLMVYSNKNKGYVVNYSENSNIDYEVYLKKNDFFEEKHLDSNNRYIASLIDYINATFKYNISMDKKNVDYTYSYRLEAEVNVKEDNGSKPLFNKKYELVNKEKNSSNGRSNVTITENLNIDYNQYNNLIKKFITIYGLNDISSTLTINMYVDVDGNCDEYEENDNQTVTSLVIPLTTKTIGIDIKNNLTESNDRYMICKNRTKVGFIYLFISAIILLSNIVLVVCLCKYIARTRTAKSIYDSELKKILNNYHSYIQRVNNKVSFVSKEGLKIDNDFIYKKCQIFIVDTFTDMLEIRDSLNTPILMSSNKTNTATYFLILDAINKAVYVYGLKVKRNSSK